MLIKSATMGEDIRRTSHRLHSCRHEFFANGLQASVFDYLELILVGTPLEARKPNKIDDEMLAASAAPPVDSPDSAR